MADVLVVGAGPVGLTMAGELARHGVRCRIVDRLSQSLPYCRAIGVTQRTLEVWEDMGVARQMIDAGLWLEGSRSIIDDRGSHDTREAFPDLPYGPLGVPQYATESVLARHLGGFGIAVEHGGRAHRVEPDRGRRRLRGWSVRAAKREDAAFPLRGRLRRGAQRGTARPWVLVSRATPIRCGSCSETCTSPGTCHAA